MNDNNNGMQWSVLSIMATSKDLCHQKLDNILFSNMTASNKGLI